MIKGFIVIPIPVDCSANRINYSQKKGVFSCPGHPGALEHSFIPSTDLGIQDDKDTLESVIAEYSEEISSLKEQVEGLEARNSELEKESESDQRDIKALRERITELSAINEDLRIQSTKEKGLFYRRKKDDCETVRNYSNKLSETESLLEQSRSSNRILGQKLAEAASDIESLTLENKVLNERITELKRSNDESASALTKLQMEQLDLKDILARKNGYLEDLESTNKHLRNEQAGLKKTDTRAIVGAFLQYFTDVCNLVHDKSDFESLRMSLDIKSEQLEMNLRGLGLILQYHARGDELTDERVNIQTVTTEDRELDGTVKKTDCFGCRFGSDFITDLPESVTVYECKSESEKTEEARI